MDKSESAQDSISIISAADHIMSLSDFVNLDGQPSDTIQINNSNGIQLPFLDASDEPMVTREAEFPMSDVLVPAAASSQENKHPLKRVRIEEKSNNENIVSGNDRTLSTLKSLFLQRLKESPNKDNINIQIDENYAKGHFRDNFFSGECKLTASDGLIEGSFSKSSVFEDFRNVKDIVPLIKRISIIKGKIIYKVSDENLEYEGNYGNVECRISSPAGNCSYVGTVALHTNVCITGTLKYDKPGNNYELQYKEGKVWNFNGLLDNDAMYCRGEIREGKRINLDEKRKFKRDSFVHKIYKDGIMISSRMKFVRPNFQIEGSGENQKFTGLITKHYTNNQFIKITVNDHIITEIMGKKLYTRGEFLGKYVGGMYEGTFKINRPVLPPLSISETYMDNLFSILNPLDGDADFKFTDFPGYYKGSLKNGLPFRGYGVIPTNGADLKAGQIENGQIFNGWSFKLITKHENGRPVA